MPNPQETQPEDIGATGPSTDLSTKDMPAGTTGIDDGVAHDISGKPLGQVGVPAPKIDYLAEAAKMGGTPVPPKIDYLAEAAKMGGTPISPATPQKTAPEQSHDLLTRTLGWLMTKPPKDQSLATVEAQAKDNAKDNTALAQAKNVSDYIYNNVLGKDTYQHNNLTYDEKPTTAWGNVKQRMWGWLTQDEINKLPGLEPDRVSALQQSGNDYLGDIFGKDKADQLREHLLNGSWVVNQPPEVFARAAAKTVSDFFSPGYYALGAFGRVAQGYQKAAQVAATAGDWTKAASAMGKARLLGLLGASANVPFAASQAHDLVENWDKMNVPERVAAVSGILGASINTHVGINAAGGYNKVAGDALDATKQATSVATQATKKAVGSVASLGKAQDFNTAVERASDITKKGFADHRAKIQNVSPDLQAILNANPTADSPQKFAKAIDDHIQKGEQALLAASGATQHDTAPVVSNLETRLDDHLNKFFSDNRGKFGTQDEVDAAKEDIKNRIMQQAGKNPDGSPILRAPNLFESENIRQGLNIDAAPQYRTDAKPTTNAYKAGAFEAAKVMRGAIDEAYSDRGIDNVKERRQKEANLIDVRDRLAMAQQKAEAMGNGGLWDALIKRFSVPSIITAIALGHNPLALGALAPYLAGDRVYQNVKNPNRNIARAAKLAAPNASATELSFRPQTPNATTPAPGIPPTGGPAVPSPAPAVPPVAPVLPSHPSQDNPHPQIAPTPPPAPQVLAEHAANVAPATMEEPPVNHALNAELATHFGEPLTHATLDDRVEHVKNDVEAMRKTGVALTPAQTKVLGAVNEHEAAHTDAIEQTQKKSREDAYKVAEELHKMLAQEAAEEKQQKTDEAAKAKTDETEEGLKNKQAAAAPALEYTDEEIPVPEHYKYVKPRNTRIHEIGHLIASHIAGLPALDVISHLHPESDPHALAEARSDINSLRGEDGEINANKVADKLSELTVRALAGGIAEEFYAGVPFEGNRTTAGDLEGIRSILSEYGQLSDGEIDRFIDLHKKPTRKLLTAPGMGDIFERYGEKRIAGQDNRYHLNPALTAQLVGELGGINGKGNDRQTVLGQASRRVGQDEARREGTVRGEGSRPGGESLGQTQQRATGLVEKSTGDHDIDAVIRNGGGIPAGHMDMGEFGKIHMFHDPETGSTLGFKPSEKITPQNVGKKLAKSREDFAQGEENSRKRQEAEQAQATAMQTELAKTREQSRADRRHELSVDTEKAFNTKQAAEEEEPKYHSDLQKLADKFGTSSDASEVRSGASFIAPDGKFIHLGSTEHPVAIENLTNRGGDAEAVGAKVSRSENTEIHNPITNKFEPVDNRIGFMRDTGAVRTRFRQSMGGKELVASVPAKGVTDEQVTALRQAVGQGLGRNGNLLIEVGEPGGKSATKEFVSPRDVEPMLREIGAHPEQKGEDALKTKQSDIKGIPERLRGGLSSEEVLEHELAHAVVGHLEGLKADEVYSHEHPALRGGSAAAVKMDFSDFKKNGRYDLNKLKENVDKIIVTKMAGGVANELYSDLPFHENLGIGADVQSAHNLLNELGYTRNQAEDKLQAMRDAAKKYLTNSGVRDTIQKNARIREDGLPDSLHYSKAGLQNILDQSRREYDNVGQGAKGNNGTSKDDVSGTKERVARQSGQKVPDKDALKTKQKQSDVAQAANEFNKEKGLDAIVPGTTHNPELAKRIADAYDKTPHNPDDPAVEKSYNSLKKDIDDQWDYAKDKMGIKFEPWKKEGQPYANSKEMVADVKNNKHLYFFQGGELPEDHPLTEQAGEGLSYNDKLRAVHDLFGHAAHDYQFGPKGEENAWNVHRQMFSPESIPAVTTETRGQNSWVNYGQHLRVPFKEGQTVPEERTTGNATTDAAIKQGGAIPGGFEKGDPDANVPDMAHFHDPTTGSTLVLAADQVTPEAVKQELAKSRQAYLTAKPNESRIPEKGQPGYVSPTERPYAQNKAGLLPEEFHKPNAGTDLSTKQKQWQLPAGLEKGIPKDEAVSTEIPLSEISVGERAYNQATSNYFRKRGSKTDGPISIVYNPDNGQYLVEDGMHRLVQAHQEGKTTIPAKIWSGYSDIANVPLEQKMDLSPIESEEPHWSEQVIEKPFGGVNPNNPEAPSKKYGFEIAPELRHNPDALTADEAKAYSERPDVKAALAAHPDIKLGWDTTTNGPELNIGASTNNLETAKKIAGKLDQRAVVNTSTGEEIPVGGEGKKTEFPEYPLKDRLADLSTKQKATAEDDDENSGIDTEKKAREALGKSVYSPEQIADLYPWRAPFDRERGQTLEDARKQVDNSGESGFIFDNGDVGIVGSSYLHDPFAQEIGVEDSDTLNKKIGAGRYTLQSDSNHPNQQPNRLFAEFPNGKISQGQAKALQAFLQGHGDTLEGITIDIGKNSRELESPNRIALARAIRDLNAGIQISPDDFSTKQKDEDFEFGHNVQDTEDQQKGIISTAVPGGKNAIADPHTENVHVGMQSLTPETKVKIADKIRKMPGMRTPENITDPDKVIGRYINQFKDNLKDLYNRVPAETRDQTAKWYESANKIADKFASKYGKSTKQGAGVLAAMSPQKDWNMNVGLAERLTDIYHQHANEPLTPEARAKAREIGLGGMAAAIGDKTFSQLTEPLEKAAFIRIYDEANNDRSFQNVDPGTGEYTNVMKNNDGSNSKIAWGALNEIAKAVNILDDGSRENISRNLGMSHKVRNFYNNIIDPNNPGGHVTIDTHAVAAGHQRPLSGADPEVLDNFGRISALKTGLKGTYAVNAEAYRRAAQELGLQPRQLQSIVWEQIRKDFPAELKTNETHRAAIDDIWSRYKDGKITQKEAQEQTREYAKTAREQIEANAEKPSTQQDLFPVLPSKFVNFKKPVGQEPSLESGLDKLGGK